jgi:hypothetical protein
MFEIDLDFLTDLASDPSWIVGFAVFAAIVVVGIVVAWRGKQREQSRFSRSQLVYGYGRTTGDASSDRPPRGSSQRGQPTAEDPFTQGASREKRVAARRSGTVVKVAVADTSLKGVEQAWVVDRSTTGLGLCVGEPAETGTKLKVRPWDAGDMSPWIDIVVRNCKREGDSWKIGCQFVRTPPWSVLLLFG